MLSRVCWDPTSLNGIKPTSVVCEAGFRLIKVHRKFPAQVGLALVLVFFAVIVSFKNQGFVLRKMFSHLK